MSGDPSASEPIRPRRTGRYNRFVTAVFIDFENLFFGLSALETTPPVYASPHLIMLGLAKILYERHLEPRLRLAYANWNTPELHAHQAANHVFNQGYRIIHTFGKRGSSAADMHLAIDAATEMAVRGHHYHHCIIASGDSDLAPAIRKLKDLGTYHMLVVSPENSLGAALRAEATEFVYLDPYYHDACLRPQ